MIRLALLLCLLAQAALAQSREVHPDELKLEVMVSNEAPPYAGEMVLITIRGTYRRHITRETLQQPALDGFNWMQLGADDWHEETVRGRPVKIFQRRMALFPERAGELTIGPFTHQLTLTDEGNDWFPHEIASEPVTLHVEPAPVAEGEGWWFPVRQLRVHDTWSNAPDQLSEGGAVLRVIQVIAVGASPEMIPPMPELSSPTAMILPHPEKRLVELSPEGPVTHAFWRWTVRPTNDNSAILEPISFDFFDTRNRVSRTVTISPQRVAYESATLAPAEARRPPAEAALPGWPALVAMLLALAAGLTAALAGPLRARGDGFRRSALADPLAWRLKAAARRNDLATLRRTAAGLQRRDGPTPGRAGLLEAFDRALFAPGGGHPDARKFARAFLAKGPYPRDRADTNG